MHIAFLTMAGKVESLEDDELAAEELRRRGHGVVWAVWDDVSVTWSDYDGVVIRSPFDYIDHTEHFLRTLARIEAQTRLFNGLPWVRWNADKRYLLDLTQRDVAVVPTHCVEELTVSIVESARRGLGGGELIVKPSVGASGKGVHRVPVEFDEAGFSTRAARQQGPWLIQPMVASVLEEGETSLMFFDGQLSHAVQKVPQKGAFLVQEEHGGATHPVTPSPAMRHLAEQVLEVGAVCVGADRPPLYARVDLVLGPQRDPQVMEVEVIEPQLFLSHGEEAAAKLAQALERRLS